MDYFTDVLTMFLVLVLDSVALLVYVVSESFICVFKMNERLAALERHQDE